ncbi:MAG: hypothetical protein GXP27_14890 [Planctomycetes bacterium]|nr:hypothetical protein [Planctomycetota bacterium]
MKRPYGPWTTEVHPGSNPHLSGFWKKRFDSLARLRGSDLAVSRSRRLSLLCLALFVCCSPSIRAVTTVTAEGDGPAAPAASTESQQCAPVIRANYVIVPMQGATELQKRLLPRTKHDLDHARAFVLVNGSAIAKNDKTLDASALDLTRLRNDLKKLADHGPAIIFFDIYHRDLGASREVLYWFFVGFGPSIGFEETRVSSHYLDVNFDWQRMVADVRQWGGQQSSERETGIGDRLAVAYPVTTVVSRILTGGADCFVDILPAFRTVYDDGLARDLRKSITGHVRTLKLRNKKRLLVGLRTETQEGRNEVNRFVESGLPRLGEELGFETATVQHQYR